MDVKLRIHRFVEGKQWVQDYTLPVTVGMTVLEALTQIKEHQDPTLSFTCSCSSSICGACSVRVNGKHQLVSVTIKPEACDPDDVEMLQDMIVAAANEAMRQIDEIAEKEMSSVTGGMGLPGGLF